MLVFFNIPLKMFILVLSEETEPAKEKRMIETPIPRIQEIAPMEGKVKKPKEIKSMRKPAIMFGVISFLGDILPSAGIGVLSTFSTRACSH